jgi:hypothetical protein
MSKPELVAVADLDNPGNDQRLSHARTASEKEPLLCPAQPGIDLLEHPAPAGELLQPVLEISGQLNVN